MDRITVLASTSLLKNVPLRMAAVRVLTGFARTLELAQGSSQGLYLPFIGIALTFKILQRFQNLVHLLKAFLKRMDDIIDLFDCGLDARLGSRLCRTRMGQR